MRFYQQLLPYAVAIGSTAIALILTLWFQPFLYQTIGGFFYIAILVTAWYGDVRSGFVAVVLSTLAINNFFIPPPTLFEFDRPNSGLELGIFFLVASTINLLMSNFRDRKQLAPKNPELMRIAPTVAQMGIWNWNIATGQIYWSPDHELLFGLTPGIFDGRYETFLACLHPEDKEPINQAVQQAIQNKILYQVEYRIVWPDGSIHWIEARGHALYNQAGEPIQMTGTVSAIDQRKQAQGLLKERFEQQRLVMKINQRIQESLSLENIGRMTKDILQMTVDEAREFLKTDRVIIFQFDPKWKGTVIAESVGADWIAILSTEIYDPCFGENYVEPYKQGLVTAKSDIYKAGIDSCHLELLTHFQVKANLVVPIVKGSELWGLLIAHNCASPRQWQSTEIDLLKQLASQVSIALQQAELFKQVQTELAERRQAEAILQLFVKFAPAGIAMFDRDMRFLMTSQRWVEQYNLESVESLIGRSHYEVFPDIPRRWRQVHQRCLAGAIEKSEEDLFVRADGTEQWVWWEIHPWYTATDEIGGIIIFGLDISDRKQAEIALKESQIQLQRQLNEIETIYQSAPIGLTVLDTELRFIRINQRLAEINGFPVEAHIGRTVREMLPNLAEIGEQLWRSILETGEPILNMEIVGETPAQPGVQRTWSENWLPLKEGDDIIGINIVCEEITDRKQLEIILQQLNVELELRVAEETAKLTETTNQLIETLTALQESEERRRLALDLTHIGFWDMHLPSEDLVWNDIHFTLLGLDPFSVKPTRDLWRSFVHPDDLGRVEQNFSESMENHTDFASEHRVIHPDGSVHWLMTRAKAIYDELGQPVRSLGVLLDISDRKRTELMLELQAVITRNMAEGVCLIKADTAVIVYANPKFEQMFGYDPGELNGQHISILEYVTEEVTAEDVSQAILSAIFQNGEATYEVRNIKKDGTPFWCSVTCSIFKHPDYGDVIVAVRQDITLAKHLEEVRQQAEEALRKSEAKFRFLTESAPIGIFMTDIQGQCTYTNPHHQEICGCTFDEFLRKGCIQFIHPEDREEMLAKWSIAMSQKQEFSGEYRYLRKDGTIRFGRVLSVPIFSVGDEWIGYVGTVEDITESRAIETIKREFISIVSHELRTPLASIRGSLGLLASGTLKNKPETAQQMLNIAIHDTDRLVRLVNDILDLERLETQKVQLNKQWCNAVTLMRQSVEIVQYLAVESNITLSVEPTSIQVWADSDRITQTLVNLVSNAIKFSPPETTITLSAQEQTEQVLFQIKDQGRVIPTDKIKIIFERFQQVDASDSRQKGGTGLGLAICKSIVQQHGGKIWAESFPEQGSSFYFSLPKLLN